VGLRIHGVKDQNSQTDTPGPNPFDSILFQDGSALSSVCRTYDWVSDDGRNNLGKWVDEAFEERKKFGAEKKLGAPSQNPTAAHPEASQGFVPHSPHRIL
jgi:hypothetical protein